MRNRTLKHVYYACKCGQYARTYNTYSVHKRYTHFCDVCFDFAFKKSCLLNNEFSCPSIWDFDFEDYAIAWGME